MLLRVDRLETDKFDTDALVFTPVKLPFRIKLLSVATVTGPFSVPVIFMLLSEAIFNTLIFDSVAVVFEPVRLPLSVVSVKAPLVTVRLATVARPEILMFDSEAVVDAPVISPVAVIPATVKLREPSTNSAPLMPMLPYTSNFCEATVVEIPTLPSSSTRNIGTLLLMFVA